MAIPERAWMNQSLLSLTEDQVDRRARRDSMLCGRRQAASTSCTAWEAIPLIDEQLRENASREDPQGREKGRAPGFSA